MMNQIDEDILIRQLQDLKTRKEAFAKVVRYYSEPLYWQIRKLVFLHDDAKDLLQNTFVKAWTNLDGFRADSRLSTWLYRIAINESLSFLQKQKNRVSIDQEDSTWANTLLSDEYFDGDEIQAKFQEALSRLPEKQRLVFQMKYFEEMKYEEIADILQTSVGALKASYHHAVKKIADYFHLLD